MNSKRTPFQGSGERGVLLLQQIANMSAKMRYWPLLLLSRLPWPILERISGFCAVLLSHFPGYRRSLVAKNIQRAFPEKDPAQQKKLAKAFYAHFSDQLLGILKSFSASEKELQERFVYGNPNIFDPALEKGKSAMIYVAHLGNWEWFSLLPKAVSSPVYSLYLPLSNRYFDGLMRFGRERFGIRTLPSSKAYRVLLELRKKGERNITMFGADQSPPGPENVHWVDFLGQRTAFIQGPEVIARTLGCAVFFARIALVRRNFYHVEFLQLWDGEEALKEGEITTRYAAALEENIRLAPQLWLWSHRRWKHKFAETGT